MLKAWRLSLKMSQAKFGRCLAVSRSTINRWEGGLQPIPAKLADRKFENSPGYLAWVDAQNAERRRNCRVCLKGEPCPHSEPA